MKNLFLIFALLTACAEVDAPTDQPVAGSDATPPQEFKCKLTVTTDVLQKLGALCLVGQTV